jgi:hypothetical protein
MKPVTVFLASGRVKMRVTVFLVILLTQCTWTKGGDGYQEIRFRLS